MMAVWLSFCNSPLLMWSSLPERLCDVFLWVWRRELATWTGNCTCRYEIRYSASNL